VVATTESGFQRVNRVLDIYGRQGWYPIPWRHHPAEVRDLIRVMRFRPQMKCCYMNSQRFLLGNQNLHAGLDLEYREGWIMKLIPIQHAWLLYNGEVLDLTLDSRETHYLKSIGSTIDQVLSHMIETGVYGEVVPYQELHQISPWLEHLDRLEQMVAQKSG
jgi:hypothetical protein